MRKPIYSARVDLDWRAVGVLKDGTFIWFWVESHKPYVSLLLSPLRVHKPFFKVGLQLTKGFSLASTIQSAQSTS